LEAGDLKQVKNQLEALRAIAACADAIEDWRSGGRQAVAARQQFEHPYHSGLVNAIGIGLR
jgi:hypothetical protein